MSYARCMTCNRQFSSPEELAANDCHPSGGLAIATEPWMMARGGFARRGEHVKIYEHAKIVGKEHIALGSHVIIDDFTLVCATAAGIEIGDYVHIGAFSLIQGGGRLTMGDFSGISAGVRLFTGNDSYDGRGLTNPSVPAEYRAISRSFIDIGRHCIVGANSVVLPGVKIGEGAVVGACSLVKHDLEPWTVNVGTPARAVKMRPREVVLERERELRAREARQ